MSRLPILALIILSFAHAADLAIAPGVKVVSDKNPDVSSVETLLKDILKPDMNGQQKGEAIFDYMVHRIYHHNAPEEPIGDGWKNRKYNGENTKVMDAVKNLNVYGHAICGSTSWYENLLFNAAGLKGRIGGVDGHTVPEAFYDGKWHLFDVDMGGFVRRKEDGTVPSVDEIKADKNLLLVKHEKTPEIYFKNDGPKGEWGCLQSGMKSCYYGRKIAAHSMNLTLREGESLTRYFQRQWAPNYRYYSSPWTGNEYLQRLKGENKQGPGRDLTHYLFKEKGQARFGNWEMTYQPPLAKPSAMDGIYSLANTVHSAAAPFLRPEKAGTAEVIYNFYSPYGCAGNPNDLTNPDDDTDGAILEGEFATEKGAVAYSLDLGKSWNEVHKTGGKFKLDLTPKLAAHYGWLVKLSFEGQGAGLKSFKSSLSGQLSPASLPYVDGKTNMTFTRSDADCILFDPDITGGTDSEAEFKRLSYAVENFESYSESISGHIVFKGNNGAAIFKVEVPGDIVRVQTGAKFGCRKANTLNGVSFSIDDGKTWIVACQQPVMSSEPDHPEDYWAQCVDGILDFNQKKAYSLGCTPGKNAIRESTFEPKPTKSVLVKFNTQGGDGRLIHLFGIYVHYKHAGASKLPLAITHKWKGGEHIEQIGAAESEKKYTVNGGALDTNESIKIEAVSK